MDSLSAQRRRCATFAAVGAALGSVGIVVDLVDSASWDPPALEGQAFFIAVLALFTAAPLILVAADAHGEGSRYGVPAACGIAVTLAIDLVVMLGVRTSDSSTAGVGLVFLPFYGFAGVLVCWFGRVIVRAGERTRASGAAPQ